MGKNKTLCWCSAGSYVACPTIEMATWKHPNRDTHGLTDLTGLGFVSFLMTVHYKDDYLESIKKGMEKAMHNIKILKDGQALLVNDDEVELLGDQETLDNLIDK